MASFQTEKDPFTAGSIQKTDAMQTAVGNANEYTVHNGHRCRLVIDHSRLVNVRRMVRHRGK